LGTLDGIEGIVAAGARASDWFVGFLNDTIHAGVFILFLEKRGIETPAFISFLENNQAWRNATHNLQLTDKRGATPHTTCN
jgi:hypothetical protein